jgi:3-hexulose-6-phosphate synthase
VYLSGGNIVALTQMALDSLDFDATVALAAKVAPHVYI